MRITNAQHVQGWKEFFTKHGEEKDCGYPTLIVAETDFALITEKGSGGPQIKYTLLDGYHRVSALKLL